jgi:hypothetical protein
MIAASTIFQILTAFSKRKKNVRQKNLEIIIEKGRN